MSELYQSCCFFLLAAEHWQLRNEWNIFVKEGTDSCSVEALLEFASENEYGSLLCTVVQILKSN